MTKRAAFWLILAASLILVGGIVFVSTMMALDWDFSKLSTTKYETNRYTLTESFQNISIVTDTADITLIPSESNTGKVVCREKSNMKHSVRVEGDTLTITLADTRKWYEHIGFFFGATNITLSLPQEQYKNLLIEEHTGDVEISEGFTFEAMDIEATTGDITNRASATGLLKIETDTGNIRAESLSAGTLKLSVTTGDVALTDVQCQDLASDGDTGKITLKNVIAAGRFSIERSTGDVRFDGADAAELFVETDTGNVTGTLLSSKVFLTETDTGRVDVPRTITGGRCEIATDTGNIKIRIEALP